MPSSSSSVSSCSTRSSRTSGTTRFPLTVEVFRDPGTAPGAAFSLELAVQYATSVEDPFVVG